MLISESRGHLLHLTTQHLSRTSAARHCLLKYPILQLDERLLHKLLIHLHLNTIDPHVECVLFPFCPCLPPLSSSCRQPGPASQAKARKEEEDEMAASTLRYPHGLNHRVVIILLHAEMVRVHPCTNSCRNHDIWH